jgi:hypothetical protein
MNQNRGRRYERGDIFRRGNKWTGYEWLEVLREPSWDESEGCWSYWCRLVVPVLQNDLSTEAPGGMVIVSGHDSS